MNASVCIRINEGFDRRHSTIYPMVYRLGLYCLVQLPEKFHFYIRVILILIVAVQLYFYKVYLSVFRHILLLAEA